MPSFDVVSRVDMQEVDNAVNNACKEIATRYDFRSSNTQVTLDRKEKQIHVVTADKMKMQAVQEILANKAAKRNINLKSFEFQEPQPTSHGALKCDVKVKEGIDHDTAKQIVRLIKEAGIKVQASIQGEEVRVSGKKIDDLQSVIAMLRSANLDVPLQYVNMKS